MAADANVRRQWFHILGLVSLELTHDDQVLLNFLQDVTTIILEMRCLNRRSCDLSKANTLHHLIVLGGHRGELLDALGGQLGRLGLEPLLALVLRHVHAQLDPLVSKGVLLVEFLVRVGLSGFDMPLPLDLNWPGFFFAGCAKFPLLFAIDLVKAHLVDLLLLGA